MMTNPAPACTLASWRAWLALWMGWLAMGQLGSVMAWSWFSGLAGVVAWWCWLQWAPPRWYPRHLASQWLWLLLAVLGMAAVMLAGRHQALGWLGWALAIAGWAQTLLGLQQRHASKAPIASTAPGWPRAWLPWMAAPAMAFGVAAVAADPSDWQRLWPLAAVMLLGVAWPSQGHAPHQRGQSPLINASPVPAMAQATTLLMMGSLPLMSAWCLANGQSVLTVTAVHLWAMAWACHLAQTLLAHSPRLPLRTWHGLGNLLLVNAALVAWLGSALWQMALVMGLLAAASAVWQASTAHALSNLAMTAPSSPLERWLHVLPPLGLLWLGHMAPTHGPQALSWALAGLAVLALLNRPASQWPASGSRISPSNLPAHLQQTSSTAP